MALTPAAVQAGQATCAGGGHRPAASVRRSAGTLGRRARALRDELPSWLADQIACARGRGELSPSRALGPEHDDRTRGLATAARGRPPWQRRRPHRRAFRKRLPRGWAGLTDRCCSTSAARSTTIASIGICATTWDLASWRPDADVELEIARCGWSAATRGWPPVLTPTESPRGSSWYAASSEPRLCGSAEQRFTVKRVSR